MFVGWMGGVLVTVDHGQLFPSKDSAKSRSKERLPGRQTSYRCLPLCPSSRAPLASAMSDPALPPSKQLPLNEITNSKCAMSGNGFEKVKLLLHSG